VPFPEIAVRDLVFGDIEAGRTIEIEAYAIYAGELLLFDSQTAADHQLIYPYCLSANSHELDSEDRRSFHGKWVRVMGTFVAKDKYDDPPNSIRTMGSADGLAFPNQCWSPFMLRIEQIVLIAPVARTDD
jgi:hypothetical protein